MSERPSILIVDDEVSNIEILSATLEEDHDIYFATTGTEAIEIARTTLPDLILLDVLMPGVDGYEVCAAIKADPLIADVPVIFTTALGDQEAEVKGLMLGAIDYITKPILPVVVRARIRNHLDMKRMRDELAEMAVTDALTGLGNRRRLEKVLNQETSRLSRSGGLLSVIILDIDFFKKFNDLYGHTAGDRCLTMVAAALNRAVHHANDVTIRYGGEEFACVLPEIEHPEAMEIANSIRDRVQALGIPHSGSDASPFVSVSLGVATALCIPGSQPDSWIRAADEQLYVAKAAGRNLVAGIVFATDGVLPVASSG
ncbi:MULTISPECIES: diguanylate cyclase [Kaistia]|uniref:diguanylate cyclase n=1 Tax=Kaistia nematophila TaxID=2994654 RepID=A0A9X3E0P0_9HYPH|nr:diguanylate cyclase [Kaistia nematophila]MBN9026750.1 diguanylate cyclase [Hyphomicrobiales bacterium]MBN9059204.1 diguanylate cyclase [Hyphomicrobiales bacterium]MCX5568981.1 diguanylate cyclase [Kaistia nematophila]